MCRAWYSGVAISAAFFVGAATAQSGQPELEAEIARIAAEVLQAIGDQPVRVGIFSPSGRGLDQSNAGPGIEADLRTELGRLQPERVRADASLEVSGQYAYARVRDVRTGELKFDGRRVIQITAHVIDTETSTPLRLPAPLEAYVDSNRVTAALTGITASIPRDGSKEVRQQGLEQALSEPSVFVSSSLVRSRDDSPYAVELLVKSLQDKATAHPVPREPVIAEGQAFVEISETELYEVRVYNNSPRPLAVALTVDGIDVFHFSTDRNSDDTPRFTHFIIAPAGRAPGSRGLEESAGAFTVPGWHHALEGTENYHSFLVTGYGHGAATQAGLAARGSVGQIHVQFSECAPLLDGQASRSGTETGFGPARRVEQKAVRYEIEPPHEFVTIRYNR